MKRHELLSKIDEISKVEDDFVERLSRIDLTTLEHSHFRVTVFLKIKNVLTRLTDDSRRHGEIIRNLARILEGDERDEY